MGANQQNLLIRTNKKDNDITVTPLEIKKLATIIIIQLLTEQWSQ